MGFSSARWNGNCSRMQRMKRKAKLERVLWNDPATVFRHAMQAMRKHLTARAKKALNLQRYFL